MNNEDLKRNKEIKDKDIEAKSNLNHSKNDLDFNFKKDDNQKEPDFKSLNTSEMTNQENNLSKKNSLLKSNTSQDIQDETIKDNKTTKDNHKEVSKENLKETQKTSLLTKSDLKNEFNPHLENLLKDDKELKNPAATCQAKDKESPTFSLKEMFAIITITGIICAFAGGSVINYKYSTKNGTTYATLLKDKNLQEFLDVYATLDEDYYASVDKKNAIDGAIDGLMKNAYDDYTSYLDKDEASSLTNSLKGTYEGIGISISNEITGLIVKVYQDSPAFKAGLQENDYVTAVNSQETAYLTGSEIAQMIKQSQNKKVNLTIKRGDETFNIDLDIETLSVPAVDYKVLSNNDKKVGYLAISTFSSTLGKQVENALKEMEDAGIQSLILDLRNNGGGLLSAAVDVANLFLEKGKAIYGIEGKDGKSTKFYYDKTSTKREYPIVVLMNGATASASEILASALIDSYGATSVGTTSYGKGKVQQTKHLSDGSLVKYTTSRWVTPNNECIDTYGINPQYGVELDLKFDESDNVIGLNDTQLAKARSLLGLPEYDETNPRYEDTKGETEKDQTNGTDANSEAEKSEDTQNSDNTNNSQVENQAANN